MFESIAQVNATEIADKYEHITSWIKVIAMIMGLFFLTLATLIVANFRGKNHGSGHGGGHAAGGHGAGASHGSGGKKAAMTVPGFERVVNTTWADIKLHSTSHNESDWKLAVIEADKFVDAALKAAGYPGDSMGERLMMLKPNELGSLQDLWDAHKLRNLLVHDIHFKVEQRQAVTAVTAFERTLKELGQIA